MEILFSKQEILWKESGLIVAILLVGIEFIVFLAGAFIFYNYKFRFSAVASFSAVIVVIYTGLIGGGCNSGLNMRINTFTKLTTVADNLSKSDYKLLQEDFLGYVKTEYNKSEKEKIVIYHQLNLYLKTGAYFQLKESKDFTEIKQIINQVRSEFELPIYFDLKDAPFDPNMNQPFDSRVICDFKFEEIITNRSENSCTLRWKMKLPVYLYPIISIFIIGLFIWIDSILLDGFSRTHIFTLIFLMIFLIPFLYLGLQRWNAETVLVFEKDKLTSYQDTFLFGKHRETALNYNEIRLFNAPIETNRDSFEISSHIFKNDGNILNSFEAALAAKYLSISVYGLPVVDKLRLCEMVSKMRL
ncbi:MAG: hypothetical protein IPL26_22335 [Leptospiraceae bacterium]|nr:hypothetical protein [Leptospiraceae bacterium]